MTAGETAEMTEIARLALASAPESDREIWRSLLQLDSLLGRIVAQAREPLLAQMRLAWWRDELGRPGGTHVGGAPALTLLRSVWRDEAKALAALVDGWEALLGDAPADRASVQAFAEGRGESCAAVARIIGCPGAEADAETAGQVWGFADAACRVADADGRGRILAVAGSLPRPKRLPPRLRPLTIIAGLSRRALARGGVALLGDRISPLVAFRLGLLGR